MPILRMKEIRDMKPEERAKKLAELRAEVSRLRTMISAGGTVENPSRVRELRKTIARILTVENSYELKQPAGRKKAAKKETKVKEAKLK
jgi:large subunit ribosomal protein L29